MSLYTGISKLISSFSNIFALSFVDLNNITISLYVIGLYPTFLSNTTFLESNISFIFFATNFASNSMFCIGSSCSSFSSSKSSSLILPYTI